MVEFCLNLTRLYSGDRDHDGTSAGYITDHINCRCNYNQMC